MKNGSREALKYPENKLILVRWHDAVGVGNEWETHEENTSRMAEPAFCYTVGWETYRDDIVLIVAPHVMAKGEKRGEELACGQMVIPITQIQDEWEIEI